MVNKFLEFIKQREAIRLRKESRLPPPWTDDPILAHGHFCNIRRNDDRVTRWLRTNWYEPHRDQDDLWFAAAVARNVNLPATLEKLTFPVSWCEETFVREMAERGAEGHILYNNAYLIRASATHGGAKAEYLARKMFTPLWESREALRPRWGDSLAEFHGRLVQQHGFGSFLAQQVVADVMYYFPLNDAPDWYSFCAPGPGSIQGLNIILGRSLKQSFKGDEFKFEAGRLQETVNTKLKFSPPLHRQDVTNALCEYAKYVKAQRGVQNLKRKYRPHEEKNA